MKKILWFTVITIWVSYLCLSCNNPGTKDNTSGNRISDSTEIINLLRTAYKWHETKGRNIIDFEIIVKDSFQVGIDTVKFIAALNELKNTNYFSDGFLKNYNRIGRETDSLLRHGKYYNEINFGFQDADPWTGFQDSVPNYWDRFKISDMRIHADSAFLKWKLEEDKDEERILVKLHRENSAWKIAYIQGFDFQSQGFDAH